MKRARAIAEQAVYGTGYLIGAAALVAFALVALPWAAYQRRRASRLWASSRNSKPTSATCSTATTQTPQRKPRQQLPSEQPQEDPCHSPRLRTTSRPT